MHRFESGFPFRPTTLVGDEEIQPGSTAIDQNIIWQTPTADATGRPTYRLGARLPALRAFVVEDRLSVVLHVKAGSAHRPSAVWARHRSPHLEPPATRVLHGPARFPGNRHESCWVPSVAESEELRRAGAVDGVRSRGFGQRPTRDA